ncbi:MAG TPA: hypothetical protein VD886_15985, partial [Herpetosiphonaceae bacterium]|nr:hypothetical protein [Herpetosiphonaceae bacterium]
KERDKLSVLRYEAQDLAQTMRLRTRDPEEKLAANSEELNDQLEDIVLDLDQLLERASLQKATA